MYYIRNILVFVKHRIMFCRKCCLWTIDHTNMSLSFHFLNQCFFISAINVLLTSSINATFHPTQLCQACHNVQAYTNCIHVPDEICVGRTGALVNEVRNIDWKEIALFEEEEKRWSKKWLVTVLDCPRTIPSIMNSACVKKIMTYQRVSSFLIRLVIFLMALFFVIAFPIAKLLDCLIGEGHGTFYRRAG